MASRIDLRKKINDKRQQLSPNQINLASKAMTRHLVLSNAFKHSQHIAFYLANKGEIDPILLMQQAYRMKKDCYLPVLHPVKHNLLWFVHYRLGDPLKVNRFGIPEPVVRSHRLRSARALDLIVMPLVAFDVYGNRYGMGRGYYDRTLSFLKENTDIYKPKLVGLAYEFQKQTKLSVRNWDVPLDLIATESKIYMP